MLSAQLLPTSGWRARPSRSLVAALLYLDQRIRRERLDRTPATYP